MKPCNPTAILKTVCIAGSAMLASSLLFATSAFAAPNDSFELHDYLGHGWTNERVTFPLTPTEAAHAAAGDALVDSDNKAVAYQVDSSDAAKPRLRFLVDLPAFGARTFGFAKGPAATATDLKVEETADVIRLSNAKTGIALNKTLTAGQGPIHAIMLNSGKWIGSSRLDTKLVPTAYSARIVSRGPVSAEAVCRQEFEGGAWWQLAFRLDANEPVVTVDESSALKDGAAAFSVSLSDNFTPDHLFYRYGVDGQGGNIGQNAIGDIKAGEVYLLEPWLRWWIKPTEGNVFSVYDAAGTDMLSISTGFAGTWVNPAMPATDQAPPRVSLLKDANGLHLDFSIRNGARQWNIAALDKDAAIGMMTDPKLLFTPSLPYQYLIKHGQFPLDMIKDYVLTWDSEKVKYPHLLVTQADVAAYKKAVKDPTVYTNAIANYVRDPNALGQFNMEGPITAYFATGDAALGKHLAQQTMLSMQSAVDTFLQQPYVPYGAAPHHTQFFGEVPLLADAVLSQPDLDPQIRTRLLAQLAFLGYSIDRGDYWSTDRGYSANPNMTTSVYGYQVAIACELPTHPLAKTWITGAMKQLKDQIDNWSDSDGGWLEAPHYAMVSYDQILGSFLMTYNAGFNNYLYETKMPKVINWFGKIATPPDSRFMGFRHQPPVGNTYISEPCGEFGIVARLWKDRDPQFARQMQWMFHQQKSWAYPGIGGGYPAFAGYRSMLLDPTIQEEAPPWQSEMFPNVGVVLRNKYPTDRESEMFLLAGAFGGWRSHYDDDSGSFTLWGKGRIIADDFGYYNPGIDDHNLLDAPTSRSKGIFYVKTFAPSQNFDYVDGARADWQRQIAFVKSTDPLAPNYFLVNDTLHVPSAATWRLWLTADSVTPTASGAKVSGKEDVDTDIFFLGPGKLDLSTESRSLKANAAIHPDGSSGAIVTTQIALIAKSDGTAPIETLIYPRLKTEAPPTVTPLAGGKGAKIETPAGIDYVFLSDAPFAFDDGDVHFQGKSGSIQLRPQWVILSLGEAGHLAAQGKEITSAGPATRKQFGG